jgi:dTDP-4-dehydrorhamnose 3,5-epimerase
LLSALPQPRQASQPPQMERQDTGFPGLFRLQTRVFRDLRGLFVKTFHADLYRSLGVEFHPREEFYSISRKGVVRGMHVQVPPSAHAKLIYCLAGRVLDVVLDLRRKSPTFGKTFACELGAEAGELLFIPVGFAHGFLALEENSLMVYLTDTVHDPAHDVGIAWDSFGFDWTVKAPLLSDRDKGFQRWEDFSSPF